MKNLNRDFYLILLSFSFAFFTFISSLSSQTNYYTTSSGDWDSASKWTPTRPGSTISSGDSVFVSHNMNIGSISEIIVEGVVVIESSGEMRGDKKITVNSGGTLINEGNIVADEEVLDYGRIYNSNTMDIKKITVYNYLCNTGTLSINSGELIHIYGGTIECGGDLVAEEIKIENNGGDVAVFGGGNICDGVDDPTVDLVSGTIDSSNVIICGRALPVELYSYVVKLKNNKVRIDWSTASEIDNDYFVVERSQDAYHFEEIGREEGAGFSESFRYYAITDRFPFEGISYYRLKQVDCDGTTTYFDIKMVDNNDGYTDEHGLTVYPNPIMEHSKFSIGLEGFEGDAVQGKIQNMSGFLIYSDEINISEERELIDLETNIIQDSGMYVILSKTQECTW
jgi:hypothetical protein